MLIFTLSYGTAIWIFIRTPGGKLKVLSFLCLQNTYHKNNRIVYWNTSTREIMVLVLPRLLKKWMDVLMMIYRPWRAVDLACWVCLHCCFVHLCVFHHRLLFNTWLPYPAQIKVWKLWIFMAISIVLLFIFVDFPLSFFKNVRSLKGIFFHLSFIFHWPTGKVCCSLGPVYHHLEAWYWRLSMVICTIWLFGPKIR